MMDEDLGGWPVPEDVDIDWLLKHLLKKGCLKLSKEYQELIVAWWRRMAEMTKEEFQAFREQAQVFCEALAVGSEVVGRDSFYGEGGDPFDAIASEGVCLDQEPAGVL